MSENFRRNIEECFSETAERIAACLEVARECRDIPPDVDTRRVASLLVDYWVGRASAEPLSAMLDFYFSIGLPSAIDHVNARARNRRRR